MRTGLLIGALLLIAALATAESAYVPLTKAEAKQWVAQQIPGVSADQVPDSVADVVSKGDWAEHATPDINGPKYLAVLSGRDLTLTPFYKDGLNYDLMTLGPWDYHVRWPVQTIKGFETPDIRPLRYALWAGGGGLVLGFIGGALFGHALR